MSVEASRQSKLGIKDKPSKVLALQWSPTIPYRLRHEGVNYAFQMSHIGLHRHVGSGVGGLPRDAIGVPSTR
jgi:hypothetical protein